MRWQRTFQTIDVHCEGEIGRVVSAGILNVPGKTIADKLTYLNSPEKEAQDLRNFLTSEPRANAVGSMILIPPAHHPKADIGFLVLQPDQAHAMSGSNAICATTALLECGYLPMKGKDTQIVFDTAAGLVTAHADCSGDRVNSVSIDMPAAYCCLLNQHFTHPDFGDFIADIAYGGVFYAIVDPKHFSLDITPKNARRLSEIGVALHQVIEQKCNLVHPQHSSVQGLAYVMFAQQLSEGYRTCTVMRPGRLDRSPCGTGSNALMATLYAKNAVRKGDTVNTFSVIDSRFNIHIKDIQHENGTHFLYNRITGRAYLYGIHQLGYDADDPYPTGFRLSDIWG